LTHKPDNRADNAAHIQKHIDDTVRNMRKADEMMRASDNEKTVKELSEKNKRREAALDGFRREIRDEAEYQKKKS
jgi:small acid-soluble spore protein (thioredoxin-like protein)